MTQSASQLIASSYFSIHHHFSEMQDDNYGSTTNDVVEEISGKWAFCCSIPQLVTMKQSFNNNELWKNQHEICMPFLYIQSFWVNPFTPKSDQCQNSPAASQEIWHHTVWRTWLFIAYSDEKWLNCKFSLHHSYNRFLKGWENTLFELRSERVKGSFTMLYLQEGRDKRFLMERMTRANRLTQIEDDDDEVVSAKTASTEVHNDRNSARNLNFWTQLKPVYHAMFVFVG